MLQICDEFLILILFLPVLKNGDYVLLVLVEVEDYLKGNGKEANNCVLEGTFRSVIFELGNVYSQRKITFLQ